MDRDPGTPEPTRPIWRVAVLTTLIGSIALALIY
jgi:hypothetical protein